MVYGKDARNMHIALGLMASGIVLGLVSMMLALFGAHTDPEHTILAIWFVLASVATGAGSVASLLIGCIGCAIEYSGRE